LEPLAFKNAEPDTDNTGGGKSLIGSIKIKRLRCIFRAGIFFGELL